MTAKRFRVLDYQRNRVLDANTTQECYDYLQKQDMSLHTFLVECIVDDIEVNADDFMQAFRDGECPGDLQFF